MIRRHAFTLRRNYWAAWVLELCGWLFLYPLIRLFQRRRSAAIQNILIVRLDNLGDVLLATPALHALRGCFPQSRITCLVKPAAEMVLRGNPDVDDLVFFDAPWYPQNHFWFRDGSARARFRQTVRDLRRRRFDLAIHLKPFKYHEDLLLMALSGAPRRVGFGHKGGSFLLTDALDQAEDKHMIQSALDVARYLGAEVEDESLRFAITDQAREQARRLLADEGLDGERPLVCLSPTASHALIWTTDGFAEVGRWLMDRWGAQVFLVGMAKDAPMLEEIRGKVKGPTVSLAGKTDVLLLAAVLERTDLLVGVDSFARHLASAVGAPVIFLRNGGNPNVLLSPRGKRYWMIYRPMPCAPCGLTDGCEDPQCMRGIMPADVIAEIERHADEILDWAKSKGGRVAPAQAK